MIRRVGIAVGASVLAAVGLAATVVTVRDAMYADDPLPGVVVGDAAVARDLVVEVDGEELRGGGGVFAVDRAATAAAAAAAGRDSFQARVRRLADPSPPPIVVEPVLRRTPAFDAFAAGLEREAELRPPAAARVAIRGGSPRVTPARPGRVIDRDALLAVLRRAYVRGDERVAAPLADTRPELDTDAAEEAAETASTLISAPVALTYRGEAVGELPAARIARLVRFAPRGDRFVVTLDRERLAAAVRPALKPFRARAANARFAVAGDRVRILPSRPGLDVNENLALERVTAAAYSSDRTAELALRQTRADLTTKEAKALGIRERISSFTTEMGPSSANRIHNVQLMAEYIDGTVIRPGDTFSFNESVGPRTAERGFREGQMIIGSLLVPSIGGGVCQTATTLFNNAWELGLPIVARQNHSFYISHYPLGRDAAVSWGGPDFAFTNDLKTGILITTRYTNDTLTFEFWGTDPKRRVVTVEGQKVNWRSPQTAYALDPYAPAGSVRTVSGSNQMGFDVTVTRTVYERGKKLRTDAVTSNYVAVGPTAIYGPGRSIPGPYFVLPRV